MMKSQISNETLENIYTRTSTKKYIIDKMPSDEEIDAVIKAGVSSATGKNAQSPIILRITNKEVRDNLSKINANVMGADIDPFYGAPVVLVVLAKKDVPTHVYDGSIVMANMMIAAKSLNLGACWVHRAKQEFETEYGKNLLKSLGIEDEYEGIGNLILGYPLVKSDIKKRKDNWVYVIK